MPLIISLPGLFRVNAMLTYLLECSEQHVNNESFTQVSQRYVNISFYLKEIRS